MIVFNRHKNIEKKLRQAAALMPESTNQLPLSPVMEKRRQAKKTRMFDGLWIRLYRTPVLRISAVILFILVIGGTSALASNSKLRTAIARFFSSGTREEIPIDALESEAFIPSAEPVEPTGGDTGKLSGNVTKQTTGNLTLVQDITIDSHFTASYVSSTDYLTLEETPSGTPLFSTWADDGKKVYYSFADGKLTKIDLETKTLTSAVQPGKLPGIMPAHSEDIENYCNLTLPLMKFTVSWQQYGKDILINDIERKARFDIGSTYGIDLGKEYDGQFFYRALSGNGNVIEVLFCLDAQQTNYQYPFLLNLNSGEISDPLALVDLSSWPCITELSIQADLATATAMAGSSHKDLREIIIDLRTGNVTDETMMDRNPPADNCVTWFPVGRDTLFYVTGTEESGDGYLYNTQTKKSTALFTDTTVYSMWGGVLSSENARYWKSIGYGYLAYFADHAVSLIHLDDGGKTTLLKGIPMCQNVDFFINAEASVLNISMRKEDSFHTSRLCFLDLKTMDAWYFDRDLPENVEEKNSYWNGEYGYVIEAENTKTGTNYIYLYQYTP